MDKKKLYLILKEQASSLIQDENDVIANLANISSLLFNNLDKVNWAGFYLYKEDQLILGPFQGQPACIRIPMGKGVCGVAAQTCSTQVVEDVHQFEGHIACDAASNSEIVIPLIVNGSLFGVLDIDSPVVGRFDMSDKDGLESIAKILEKQISI